MKRHLRGFLLPAAIFLLVILAALGAYVVNITVNQRAGLALDVLGERAYQAAFAGREWVRYEINELSDCPVGTSWDGSGYSLAFSGTEVLDGMHATIECRALGSTNVAGVSTSLFEVRVTACNNAQASEPLCPGLSGSSDYVERQIQALISL